MKSGIKKAVCFTLIFMLCLSSIVAVHDSSALASKSATVANASNISFTDVTGKVDMSSVSLQNLSTSVMSNTSTTYKEHTVIVSLDGKNLVEEANGADVSEYASSEPGKRKAQALREKQDDFLAELDKLGIEYTLKNRYTAVDNAVAITINTSYVAAIKDMAGVKSVCLSETYLQPETVDMGSYASASTEEMDQALQTAVTNATSVYKTGVYDSSSVMEEYGYNGSGSVVAIIDTGLDYTHNAFIWDETHSSAYALDTTNFNKNTVANALATYNMKAEERSALNGKQISVNDVYISEKVPFVYDYADNDTDVYPSSSNHGTHVAGIVAGYDPTGYTDKNGNHVDEAFVGVAPAAQLVICKVFTDDLDDPEAGGAETEDILAALEDCIYLGVDVINMSLGTSCGFSTTDDGDDEGEMLNEVYNAVKDAGISLVCAASNDYSAAYGGTFGTNLASNPDSGTVGSPSVFAAALSVASISGQQSPFMWANDTTAVYYEESSDQYNKYYDFAEEMLGDATSGEYEYVVIPGTGRSTDFMSFLVKDKIKGRIALVERGSINFKEKVENAKAAGAIGIIVYNNVSGTVRMALGEVEDPIPSCCISMETGQALVSAAINQVGKIVINKTYQAGPFMSEFSSWGATPDLKLKPEVTAHGGEITSAVPGGYGEQSGTSMASPNMAGVVSIIRSYLKQTQPDLSTNELTQRINQLIMSTATIVYDRDDLPYSPRKQGAGLGSLANAISTGAYLFTADASIDYRPTVNLLDDPDHKGYYDITFKIKNFSNGSMTFEITPIFMTERIASNGLAVAEQAYILDDVAPTWKLDGVEQSGYELTVTAGQEAEITVRLSLSDAERNYIETNFESGMYVEGFINLVSKTAGQCDLNLPFLGFYGDWAKISMLDYDAYFIDEELQDTSIEDEDKHKASIWATQPYTTYYNDTYSMPMGSFAYLQDEDADRVYTTMEHNAVSCYDNYYGEDDPENYLTAYEFRGLYIGLMRGARKINYCLVNDATGEVIYENTAYRINKAYSGGGSAVPGFLKFELNPLEYGLVSNGKYRMDFEFFCDYGDKDRTEPDDTFSFTFYADYEAPSLREVRVRYQDEKDGNKVTQRVYLDMDVYDNHYTMAALLCYYDSEAQELNQVTEYVVPFYNCEKNTTNTVSIEITDIYEQYGDKLYVQFDDYALNHAVYYISLSSANGNATPDTFELAPGEEEINLDIYGTHKVSLIYDGDANTSNFIWTSDNYNVASVKNGEIVGLSEGTTYINVRNGIDDSGNSVQKKIKVTVSGNEKKLSLPSISFGPIINYEDKLSSGDSVSLYPDQEVTLTINTDPWYYPQEKLKIKWKSLDESVATVDENGKLTLLKKGSTSIEAIVLKENGSTSSFAASLYVTVLDPFVVSGYALSKYRGTDKLVEIPDDEMIMYISEDAFKDNSTMEEVIIPKTVINIYKNAFLNCSALKAVYLVSKEEQKIPDADLKLVYNSAFAGCSSLELIDLTNVKVITLGVNALKNCSSLKEIKNMKAIGTAFSNSFEGCTSLESVDLTGMQVAGKEVFLNCTSLKNVETGQFTDIGEKMFAGCTALKSITLNNSVIGANAFEDCSKLQTVTINGVSGESFVIGDEAFANSGLKTISFGENCIVRKIGDKAFSYTKLSSITLPDGLTEIGANIFAGTTSLKTVVLPASFNYDDIVLASGLFTGVKVTLDDDSDYAEEGGILYNKDKTTLYAVIDNTVTSVDIPSTVTRIYDYAFANSKITSITIPETVTSLGAGAFKGSKLTSITFVGDSIDEIKADTFNQTKLTSITLPASVKTIGEYAFANTLIGSIDASDVEVIGDYAFSNCAQLTSITLSDDLKSLGEGAFAYTSALDTVTISAVETIGNFLFMNSGVKTVIFGDDVKTLGEYTFVGLVNPLFDVKKEDADFTGAFVGITELKKVVIGAGIEEIGQYTFYGCSALEEVDLGGVKEIGDGAFMGCVKLETIDLSNVEIIGDATFYCCNSLDSVDLESAKSIGDMAFAMANGNGGINELVLAVAEEVGALAFYGTDLTSIAIPATLKTLGYGAFAYTSALSEISVSGDVFFLDDGVLYKNLTDGGYELVLYPSTKVIEDKVYTVLDNTIRVDAYAFAGIKNDSTGNEKTDLGVTHVVLPYTLTNVGDSAFFESGITEYTFKGLNAPVLETVYKYEVELIATQYGNLLVEPAINAYYYSNFNTLFIYYTDLVTRTTGEKSNLTINRPENGVGYDNYVYSRYFGTVVETATVEDANTLLFLEQMEKFEDYTDAVLNDWTNKANAGDTSTYYDAVSEFSAIVKEARRLYNNIKDEKQLAFIDETVVNKLTSSEISMRSIKSAYNIPVTVTGLAAQDGSYKKNYVVGETFDTTGIVIVRTYDDGSTEIVELSELTLLTTTELKAYTKSVIFRDNKTGKQFEVAVFVRENSIAPDTDTDGEDVSNDSTEEDKGGNGMIAVYVVVPIAGVALIAVAVFFFLKKKKGVTIANQPETSDAETKESEKEESDESAEKSEENENIEDSKSVENSEENAETVADEISENEENSADGNETKEEDGDIE